MKSEAIRIKAKWWTVKENAFPGQINGQLQPQKRYFRTKNGMKSSISCIILRLRREMARQGFFVVFFLRNKHPTKWVTGCCLQSDKHRFRDLACSHKILGKVTSKGAAPLQYYFFIPLAHLVEICMKGNF